MIKYTLLLPISERPFVFDTWCDNIKNINIPLDQTQVILGDATNSSVFGKQCADFLYLQGFSQVDVVSFHQNPNKYKKRNSWAHHLRIGTYCGENYNKMMPLIQGGIILCIEDDIVCRGDTFSFLLETLDNNVNAGFVSAITYQKNNKNRIIAYKDGKELIDEGDTDQKVILSAATGCFVTYSSLIKNFNFELNVFEEIASPDFCICRYIRNNYKLDIYLDQRVRTEHIYKRSGVIHKSGVIKCEGGFREFVEPKKLNYITKNQHDTSIKNNNPIFLVASTCRSGSTWIQRILSSHKDIMIWGEPQGVLQQIIDHFVNIQSISFGGIVKNGIREYDRNKEFGFIANVSPIIKRMGKKYLLELINNHFGDSVIDKKIWGIKSIDWHPIFISNMHYLYPDAVFIFLHRNLEDVEISFNKRKGWWPGVSFNVWRKNVALIREYQKSLPLNMKYINIEYDDFKDDSDKLCDFLERSLDLSENSLSRDTGKLVRKSLNDEYRVKEKTNGNN